MRDSTTEQQAEFAILAVYAVIFTYSMLQRGHYQFIEETEFTGCLRWVVQVAR